MDDQVSKTEIAYQAIKKAILDAELLPNSPLKVDLLSQETGFGRTPLRETLSRLESERFVTLASNKGYRVANVSYEELADLERARETIEVSMLKHSIDEGDDIWEGNILAAHHRLMKCQSPLEAKDKEEKAKWDECHEVFHHSLLSACNSQWLIRMNAQLNEQVMRHKRALLRDAQVQLFPLSLANLGEAEDLIRQSFDKEHHSKLMRATLDRDKGLASKLLQEHISFTLKIHETLKRYNEDII